MLTPRMTEVADLVSRGYSNKEIASLLSISHGTVKQHILKIGERIKRHEKLPHFFNAANGGMRVLITRYMLRSPVIDRADNEDNCPELCGSD